MNQNVMRSGLFCSSNNRSCGDFALRLIASCTQCTHEPLECLHSTGLLNKCTMFQTVYSVSLIMQSLFISTVHLFFVSSTDKDVHLGNHLQKLLCLSEFLHFFTRFCQSDPISDNNMRSWGQKRQTAALGLKPYSSKSLTYDQTLWQEPLTRSSKKSSRTRSLKVFRNGSTECPKSFWQFRSAPDPFCIAMSQCLAASSVVSRPWCLRSSSTCNAPGPSAEPSAPGSEGPTKRSRQLLRQLCSIWGKASEASEHNSWEWPGSVGDLSMLLHKSLPFQASLIISCLNGLRTVFSFHIIGGAVALDISEWKW